MTFLEFEKKRLAIESERFVSERLNPFEYGLERAIFRKKRNEELLKYAHLIKDHVAAQRLVQHYEQQLKKCEQAIVRFRSYVEKPN